MGETGFAVSVPLFIQASEQVYGAVQSKGPFAVTVPEAPKCLVELAKNDTLLSRIILSACKAIEDIYVLVGAGDDGEEVKKYVEGLKSQKRRALGRTKFTYIVLSPTVRTEADAIRAAGLHAESAMAKGFLWIGACVLPPVSWSDLQKFHQTVCKSDSSAVLSIYPCQVALLSSGSFPSQRRVSVIDGKTSELLATCQYNAYEQSEIHLKRVFHLEGRLATPPESLVVRSDLQFNEIFFGSPELVKLCKDNFDFQYIQDVIDNAVMSDVKMESVYVFLSELKPFNKCQYASNTLKPGSSIQSFRCLFELIKSELLATE